MSSSPAAEITVYTLPGCPYCARAKYRLKRRDLAFEEIDGSSIPAFRAMLSELTGGHTVPQIVIDGEPIGGSDQLARLDRLGVLDAIIEHKPFPIPYEERRVSPLTVVRWAAARLHGRHDVSPVKRVGVRLDRNGRLVEAKRPDPTEREGGRQ